MSVSGEVTPNPLAQPGHHQQLESKKSVYLGNQK